MIARVTMVPITSATALEMLPEDHLLELSTVEAPSLPSRYAAEQTPVLLPHALHHDFWSGMDILFMLSTKSVHMRSELQEPERGYSVGSESLLVVPLWDQNLTEISAACGQVPASTVEFVTSFRVSVLA
jgi:hypothetical protein